MSDGAQGGRQGGGAAGPAGQRPVRVLHVLAELRPSGAEVMLAAAAPHFARLGVVAEIVATSAERGSFAPRLEFAGYAVHHLPFSKSPAFFLALRRLMRGRYDAVHVHTERAAFWIGLTARGAGIPVVVRSIHSAYEFTGNLRLRRTVQRQLMKRLGMRLVAVSPSVREVERRRYALDTPVVNNWVDADRFPPADEAARRAARQVLGVAEGERVLVTVANCAGVKNHAALVEALALVPAGRRPLWLHAGGEEAGHPERALAERLGVADRIRFLGSRDDVSRLLQAADAFAMPSLFEGLPVSALEAMASGLPAILSDVSGLRDLRPLFPALLYAEPTPASLAAALERFATLDLAAWRAEAAAHPAIVRREYGVEAGVAAYARLYRGAR